MSMLDKTTDRQAYQPPQAQVIMGEYEQMTTQTNMDTKVQSRMLVEARARILVEARTHKFLLRER